MCNFDEGSILYQQVKKKKKVHLVAPGTNDVLKDTNWNCTNVFLYIKVQFCPTKRYCPSDNGLYLRKDKIVPFVFSECGVSMNHFQGCRSCTKKVNRVIFVFSFMLMLLYTHLQVLPSFHQRICLGLSNSSDWCDASLYTSCKQYVKTWRLFSKPQIQNNASM